MTPDFKEGVQTTLLVITGISFYISSCILSYYQIPVLIIPSIMVHIVIFFILFSII